MGTSERPKGSALAGERIELNVWYAEHMSLRLDLKIFFMTIFKVVTNANNENVGETGVKRYGEL
ncbi:sugar transferase [Bacteroides thetaiotaomicron]|nr:sugar transferase [Bacteroides thetaiotaomicron]